MCREIFYCSVNGVLVYVYVYILVEVFVVVVILLRGVGETLTIGPEIILGDNNNRHYEYRIH